MGESPYMKKLREALRGEVLIGAGVAAIVRNERAEVLIGKRADDGGWDLPAGAVEPGETPSEALIRETREETGLLVRPTSVAGVFGGREFRHEYPDGNVVEGFVMVFECEIVSGELHPEDGETTGFRWTAANSMPELALPYPVELFETVRNGAIFV